MVVVRRLSECVSQSCWTVQATRRGRIAYYTVRQNGCDRVEIDRQNKHLGKMFAEPTRVFIPDGKAHGKGIPISRWVDEKLEVGEVSAHVYYSVDSSGNLHMSDGRTYPQCKRTV